jgi:predicted O-methyltransferase YrrM
MSATRILRHITPPILWEAGRSVSTRVRYGKLPPWELPACDLDDIWPGASCREVTLIPNQLRRHLWGMPENELLLLAAITRATAPRLVVEFGTFTGASTTAIALNSPESTEIVTVDIDPTNRATHTHGLGVGLLEFATGECFMNMPWAVNIEQLFVDTREFEFPEWEGKVSLFFIDADHTYEFVRADTEIAKRMLMPGGVIVWHDYRWFPENPECAGVTAAVNEFHKVYGNCFQISGTRFAVYVDRQHAVQSPLSDHTVANQGEHARKEHCL